MRHLVRFVLLLGLLVSLGVTVASCGSKVQFVRLDETVYPPKEPDAPIDVLRGATLRPHAVIGTLTAHKDIEASSESSYDVTLGWLQDRARELGADALVELKTDTVDDPRPRIVLTAVAVRYLEAVRTVTTQ